LCCKWCDGVFPICSALRRVSAKAGGVTNLVEGGVLCFCHTLWSHKQAIILLNVILIFLASARSVSVVSMAATAGDAHAVTLVVPGDAESHALLSSLACAVALLHVRFMSKLKLNIDLLY
jgi:hypothetical protein